MPEPLKPCPFCGGKAYAYERNEALEIGNVICSNCGVNMEGDDETDAVRLWNRRATDQKNGE
jgi:Lar family restriction alleviation protein